MVPSALTVHLSLIFVQASWSVSSIFEHTFPSTHFKVVAFQKQFKNSLVLFGTLITLFLQDTSPKPEQLVGIGAHTLFAGGTIQSELFLASFKNA